MGNDTGISTFESPNPEALAAHWGPNAPRGARAVLTRIVKEANVPALPRADPSDALRDLGYNDTTSAICEHVDNAVQWGANEVRIYFNEVGKKNKKKIDVLVYDNGVGIAPNVLRAVTAFGGSLCFENREGIGRYGMGMKAAALSISPRWISIRGKSLARSTTWTSTFASSRATRATSSTCRSRS